jgi:hypothetical protein
MRGFLLALVLASVSTIAIHGQVVATPKGKFYGKLILIPQPDGRNMMVQDEYGYEDWEHQTLYATAGFVSDGASIPRAAWSLVGGPWDGKYRNAAVIHDVGCTNHRYSWQDTHRLFYEAMMDSGVSQSLAYTMYYAVLLGGPRWKLIGSKEASTENQLNSEVEDLRKATTLPPGDSLAVTIQTGHLFSGFGGLQKFPSNKYSAKVFVVAPGRDVDQTLLESFRDEAVQREKTATPMTLKEIESRAEGMAHPTIDPPPLTP